MAYLTGVYTDLRTIVAATWTDVLPTSGTSNDHGIWEDEHQKMIPWADLTPPTAAICVDTVPVDDGEWGTANQVYEMNVGIYYVGEITGDGTPIRAKLETLRDALLAGDISNGQIIDVTDLTWSDELEPNKVFMAKEYTHRAGRLTVQVIVGVSA